MHGGADPNIVRLKIYESEEYAQGNAGNDLAHDHLGNGILRIEHSIDRKVPQTPDNAQKDNACFHSELLLHYRLEEISPSVFLAEECDQRQRIIYRKAYDARIEQGILKQFSICGPVFSQIVIGNTVNDHRHEDPEHIKACEKQYEQKTLAFVVS